MQIRRLLGIITALSSTLAYSNCSSSCSAAASSKTFFAVRPLYQSARAEMITGFRNNQMFLRDNGIGGALDVVPFGSKSTNADRLASYFTPYAKTTLSVAEASTETFTPDLLATNFNIRTAAKSDYYSGTICLAADQASAGIGLQYKQRFCWNDNLTRGWWASISSPITWVKNKVTLGEKSNSSELTADPDITNAVTSMREAFVQPDWCYGKISCNAHSKTGLADIEAKIGYEWIPSTSGSIALYAGALIPTGNKPKAVYLFEPIVGHGGHAGIMWGSEGNYCIWHKANNSRSISLAYALHGQYLFSTKQKRSFDLVDKPWSRYLDVYANQAQAQQAEDDADLYLNTPGINVFTRDVKIKPGFSHNITTALLFAQNSFELEAGYNLFCRQAECAKLACPWPTGDDAPALKDQDGNGYLNPFRTIEGNYYIENLTESATPSHPFNASNYSNYVIQENDIDLHSAEHPALLAHTFHASCGYIWHDIEYPTHLHAGASYEFGPKNTVLNRWVVWAKGGFAF